MAQTQFRELRGEALEPGASNVGAVASADVDGDGNQDIVAAAVPPVVYRGLGNGRFRADSAAFPPGQYAPTGLVMFDADADGDVDAVIANQFHSDVLLLNDGTGRFAFAAFPVDADYTSDVVAFDADADGDLDLAFAVKAVTTGGNYRNRFYEAIGPGRFRDASGRFPVNAEPTVRIVVGDVDRDGDVDLVNVNYSASGNVSRPYSLWLNDGGGNFSDATTAQLPAAGIQGSDARLSDIDADGDPDLFVVADQRNGNRDTVYVNNGRGTFVRGFVLPQDQHGYSVLAMGDVDRDGDRDAVAVSDRGFRMLLNTGRGVYAIGSPSSVTTQQDTVRRVELADIDADGDLDVLAATAFGVRLQVNDGQGNFIDATATGFPRYPDRSYGVAAADLDGDGDTDIALTGTRAVTLVWQIAPGIFRADAPRPVGSPALGVLAVDIDRDGDRDLLIAGGSTLWTNDGRGGFTDVTFAAFDSADTQSNDVAVGDLDGDGDLDLVFGRTDGGRDGSVVLMFNRGNTTFVAATTGRLSGATAATTSVGLADLDQDGDLDLVLGNGGALGGQQNQLFLNDGSGRFVEATTRLPARLDRTTDVAIVDVSGDGRLDLVVANDGEPNRLYLNAGAAFVDASAAMPVASDPSRKVVVANFDDDPEVEMVFAQAGTGPGIYYDFDGTRFVRLTGAMPAAGNDAELAAADIDGDGDLDLAVARDSHADAIWWNLHLHLHVPDLAKLGGAFRMQLFGASANPRGSRAAVPLLGFTTLARPVWIVGVGLLHLDPAHIVTLPSVSIPFGAPATTTVPIPANVALAGLRLHMQAAIVTVAPTPSVGLSNLVTATLLR